MSISELRTADTRVKNMYIHKLSELPSDKELSFGGKADSLSKLTGQGLPVPFGFCIAAEAFENGKLCAKAEKELSDLITKLPAKHSYTVRSSAAGEDSAADSFAGAYETVLGVAKDDIPDAVRTVAGSAYSERVTVYSKERRADSGRIAVVIQRFISPEFAGVLFTADPITASTAVMTGNYVKGAGERLVSGEGSDGSFTIDAVKYSYDGPEELRPYTGKIYKYAKKIAKLCGCPQDIEWAVYKGRTYILQSRPITTIHRNNIDDFLINDSLCGEYLLSKTNVGEIFLRPVSPVTYGILRIVGDKLGIPLISNVCGQLYLNISGLCSMLVAFGFKKEKAYKMLSDLAGGIPQGLDIPIYPYNKSIVLGKIGGLIRSSVFRKKKKTDFGADFKNNIVKIGNSIISDIRKSSSCDELLSLWENKCEPCMNKALSSIITGIPFRSLFSARKKLEAICSGELADSLLSDCSVNGNIESLGVLLALEDVINGKMSREEYTARYGHRHANEMELSAAYPYEDPDFPENAIREHKSSGINAHELKEKQEKRWNEAVCEFKRLYPSKASWLDRFLKKYADAVYKRERIRSDSLWLFCMIREYLLKAGQLTGLGDDIFMLYLDEVKAYLSGNTACAGKIPERRRHYEKQLAMPYFPNIICGRFTPEEWRQSGSVSGCYRFGEAGSDINGNVITGVAGSCGHAEGRARVITSIDDADELENGEILVVPAANIGWVRIFPKAAALVTDIGAPLSHAIIVARELGIPAVVSCQCASGVLKTGDRIRVDGTAGKVFLLG